MMRQKRTRDGYVTVFENTVADLNSDNMANSLIWQSPERTVGLSTHGGNDILTAHFTRVDKPQGLCSITLTRFTSPHATINNYSMNPCEQNVMYAHLYAYIAGKLTKKAKEHGSLE
jgi:hypothetical protein